LKSLFWNLQKSLFDGAGKRNCKNHTHTLSLSLSLSLTHTNTYTHTGVWKRARRRGAGERVSLVEQCCTACQLIAQDAYYSEGVHEVRTEILAALMRELPHTATATHLLDSLGSGEKWGNRGSPHYCYLREEVEVCIDNCLMPSGVFDIAGGVVSLRSLRRREETGVRFRARRPRKMWTRDDMNILSQFNPQTKLPPPRIPTEEERGWDRSWSAEESESD